MDWFLYDNDLRHERGNPFDAIGFFLYPLKISENQKFFLCFQGVMKETIGMKLVITSARESI